MSNVTVYGLQKIRAKIDGLQDEAYEILDEEIEASAENIARMAKEAIGSELVTTNKGVENDLVGQIKNSIRPWKSGPHQWSVGIPVLGKINDMAGWLEWGTGVYVDIIPGMESYAMKWYVNGKGTILPHPFLFPAAEIERSRFITRLKKDLEGL